MGVVSGIVMPFQIGTNWSRYSDATANVVGPLLAYEGLTAFFLEAAFLGVLLFGRKLVPPWAHFVSALMVALGTLFSTFWIIATNSWMQTPAGYEIVDGRFLPKDWLQIIFSPSFPYRLAHVVDAVYITTGFVVVGVAASYLRQGRFVAEARTMLSMTLVAPHRACAASVLARRRAWPQHARISAGEAGGDRGDLGNAWPRSAQSVRYPRREGRDGPRHHRDPGPGQPHSDPRPNGVVHGLKDWPADERPSPIIVPFFGFRIMVGIAVLMLAMVVTSLWLRWRGELFDADWFLWCCTLASPLGFIAVTAGWATTEVGRQPWTVYGLLRTRQFRVSLADGLGRQHFAARLLSCVPCHVFGRLGADGETGATRPREAAAEPERDRRRAPGAAGPGASATGAGGRL